jgi:hypothetical protein
MASTYLTRTPASAGNRKTFTISFWLKRSDLNYFYFSGGSGSGVYFDSSNRVEYFEYSGGYIAQLTTNYQFKDLSAWYHVVVTYNSTEATASDRIKIWINGVQQTSFAFSTYPPLNFDSLVYNTTSPQTISSGNPLNGYLSHIHFIDGTAYDASYFGETDATTGIWKPITEPSVTYGSQGYFLKFENSGSMGTDSSGNANNFTVNGSLTQTVDTPSNVFATLNPLASLPNTGVSTFTNGNTTSQGTNSSYVNGGSTLMMSSGKWYTEMKYVATSADSRCIIGITKDVSEISRINQDTGSNNTFYRSFNGNKNVQGSDSSYANSWTTGDIIGIALDLDNEKLYFSKNGVWQNSGDPTSGASGTGAITGFTTPASTVNGGYFFFSGSDSNAQNNTVSWNFGNGYFGTTPVSSATTDESGLGIFEYTVPSGYYALCTKNINEQEYD